MEKNVRDAVNFKAHSFEADDYIKKQVREQWKQTVDAMILDALNNSEALRERIASELERKIRAQLAAAMKSVR